MIVQPRRGERSSPRLILPVKCMTRSKTSRSLPPFPPVLLRRNLSSRRTPDAGEREHRFPSVLLRSHLGGVFQRRPPHAEGIQAAYTVVERSDTTGYHPQKGSPRRGGSTSPPFRASHFRHTRTRFDSLSPMKTEPSLSTKTPCGRESWQWSGSLPSGPSPFCPLPTRTSTVPFFTSR
jgi:hypothetical protein